MLLFDVNILVYAHRSDSRHHQVIRSWIETQLNQDMGYGFSDLVGSAFLRIVTNPRAFSVPTPLEEALAFVHAVRDRENCSIIVPGKRHWEIFLRLCRESRAKGNLIPDAYLAAMAVEHGCEWASTDADYARFQSLKWVDPLRDA